MLAFDPFITRRLHSFMPLRVIEMSPQEEVWGSVEAFCSGLQELYHLSGIASLCTWEVKQYSTLEALHYNYFLDRWLSSRMVSNSR